MNCPSQRNLDQNSEGYRLLKRMQSIKKPVVCIDTTDVFTARFIEQFSALIEGLWISSLGVSSRLFIEDAYNISPRDYLALIRDMLLVKKNTFTIVDADNGGQSYKNTDYAFKLYNSLQVAIGIIENKRGTKYNSVDKNASKLHSLEDNGVFAEKIKHAKKQDGTLVAIRIENGIVNDDNPEDAISESLKLIEYFYNNEKPDMFVFHWKKEDPTVVLRFAELYMEKYADDTNRPLLGCIPTTYSKNITNISLYEAGYNLIIYGNILLRTQLNSIKETLKDIESVDSLQLADSKVPSVEELFGFLKT